MNEKERNETIKSNENGASHDNACHIMLLSRRLECGAQHSLDKTHLKVELAPKSNRLCMFNRRNQFLVCLWMSYLLLSFMHQVEEVKHMSLLYHL